MNCKVCKKPITRENCAPDALGIRRGTDLYSIQEREIIENPLPGTPREKMKQTAACKDCYLKWYKETYPDVEQPKLD